MGKLTEIRVPFHTAAAVVVAPLLEAAAEMSHEDIRRALQDALGEVGKDDTGMIPWVRDVWDEALVYEWGGKLWRSSYTIQDGTATLADAVEVRITYTPIGEAARDPDPDPDADPALDYHGRPFREVYVEALKSDAAFRAETLAVLNQVSESGDVVPLVDLVESARPLAEAAVSANGEALIKLIEPGWGSSGYYSKPVLERDGAAAFPKGTKMFWDHATTREDRERPEGSLDRLAAELTEDARFNAQGREGPGLYAPAKVFRKFAETVDELAPHIGVSIRARGKVIAGTAEGKTGPIVDELVEGISVDFVTMPGAGGKVVEMFEAAGRGSRSAPDPKQREGNVDELQEAQKRADDAEAKLAEAEKTGREATERATTAETRLLVVAAREAARKELTDAKFVKLPVIVKARIAEAIASDPPVKDGDLDPDALKVKVAEAADAERKYLAGALGNGAGRVTGLGESTPETPAGDEPDPDAPEVDANGLTEAEWERSLEGIGLSESAAKIGAKGRR